MDKKRTVSYLILGIERTCKRKMCILSAEKFFEIELCQRTRISLIKLYDKYLPFCNFYALVSHAIFFSRKTRTRKSQKNVWKLELPVGLGGRKTFERLGRAWRSGPWWYLKYLSGMVGRWSSSAEAWPAINKIRKE